jgi:hypothetical protein
MTKKSKPTRDLAEQSKRAARCATLSEVNSSAIIETFAKDMYGDTSGQEAYELLHALTTKADTPKVSERMLLSQAHALDVMFANLARRAASNIGRDRLPVMETYMRLALRAQNQARMTLETLATIKNPPVVFAKQANIANNQQVNNGEAVSAGIARARETRNQPNEQSRIGHDQGQSLDGGALQTTIASNPPLEAVATVNRPTND